MYTDQSKDVGHTSTKRILLVISIVTLIIIIITLAIVLPIVLTNPKNSPENRTPQQFITKCQSELSNSVEKFHQNKGSFERIKMYRGAKNIGNNIRLENTYLVEFKHDSNEANHLAKVTKSLKLSDQIDSSKIQHRSTISSKLFSGVSFTVNANHSIESIEMIHDAIAVYPVYTFNLADQTKASLSIVRNYETINSYNLTRVEQVHRRLRNFGAGVRVAIIDSGVYYKHPALGGCFGPGCKVEFGYDFVGDGTSASPMPDNDPLDNCTTVSHGTHVAGIIAANTTGITEQGFVSALPFIGIAPQVTLGAYRVTDCASAISTDLVTQAIYRAYSDKADIINLSLGGPGSYPESSITIAVQRVISQGVYVVSAAGNDGSGGLQTGDQPAVSQRDLSVGSIDNVYYFSLGYSIIIAPDGTNIPVQPGTLYGQWKSIVNRPIVVNNPNSTVNDGCTGPLKSVFGAFVLFYMSLNDSCNSTIRCDLAAVQGALGCLLYNADEYAGGTNIPSGRIGYAEALSIITQTNVNASVLYTFTNYIPATELDATGRPSSFSSFGPTGDLFFEPQITGIGGYVYSTISPYSASLKNMTTMYDLKSGTSMACPYVTGTLALFLASIGNPPAITANGKADNGICRPAFSTVINIFQSTARPVNIYNTSLLAPTIKQGAGLVDVYSALTTTTIISPSQLSLNDTVRKAEFYKVKIYNLGSKLASYKMSHVGAALATGKLANDDQLLTEPLYSADYANVSIEPSEFSIEPAQSREITLRFSAPQQPNQVLLPIYSGFIYVTNQNNGEIVHLSYVGMLGDYGNARILVRNTSNPYRTDVLNANNESIATDRLSNFNATQGIQLTLVLAWATRLCLIEVISPNNTLLPDLNSTRSILRFKDSDVALYLTNMQRNTVINTQSFITHYPIIWDGYVCPQIINEQCSNLTAVRLRPSLYQIQYSVLKHFGNSLDAADFEIYRTPTFNLVY